MLPKKETNCPHRKSQHQLFAKVKNSIVHQSLMEVNTFRKLAPKWVRIKIVTVNDSFSEGIGTSE
jgi:hypothetical protein